MCCYEKFKRQYVEYRESFRILYAAPRFLYYAPITTKSSDSDSTKCHKEFIKILEMMYFPGNIYFAPASNQRQ